MTTPFWCLFATLVIPYGLAGAVGYFKTRQFGSLDNHYPRIQGAQLEGIGARAWAAQENAWEAVALFSAAVVVAHFAGADPGTSAIAAVIFVLARLLHAVCYLADWATPRTLVFVVSLGCVLTLFALAAQA